MLLFIFGLWSFLGLKYYEAVEQNWRFLKLWNVNLLNWNQGETIYRQAPSKTFLKPGACLEAEEGWKGQGTELGQGAEFLVVPSLHLSWGKKEEGVQDPISQAGNFTDNVGTAQCCWMWKKKEIFRSRRGIESLLLEQWKSLHGQLFWKMLIP